MLLQVHSTLFRVRTQWYFNTAHVVGRLGQWRNDIMARAGAYGLGTMRNLLSRPQLRARVRQDITFVPEGREIPPRFGVGWRGGPLRCWVPTTGPVIDMRTQRPVNRFAARRARHLVRERRRGAGGRGEGRPPRMGPTRLLRNISDFRFDERTESVVIGIIPFRNQPEMRGTVSVPQLLNQGGYERVRNLLTGQSAMAHYGPRPYVERCLRPTVRFAIRLIQTNPVH